LRTVLEGARNILRQKVLFKIAPKGAVREKRKKGATPFPHPVRVPTSFPTRVRVYVSLIVQIKEIHVFCTHAFSLSKLNAKVCGGRDPGTQRDSVRDAGAL